MTMARSNRWKKSIMYTSMLCRPYQRHPHLQSFWWKNLGLEAVKWKTVANVGMAHLRPPCLQVRNISTRRCLNPLRFLVFDSETGDEPVSHAKPHVPLRKTVAQLLGRTAKSQERSWNYCKVLSGNLPFPYLRTVTQLPVSNTIRFYDPNIPFHLLNARLTAQYVFKTYDTYAFRAN